MSSGPDYTDLANCTNRQRKCLKKLTAKAAKNAKKSTTRYINTTE
jgi:hypothetical protein